MSTLVVGAGEASVHFVTELRRRGYSKGITIVGDEPVLPYQRPPLSKGLLMGTVAAEDLILRDASFYAGLDVDVVHDRIVEVEAPGTLGGGGRAVGTSGRLYRFTHLALAHGGRARALSDVPGQIDQHVLRTVDDANRLRDRLAGGPRDVCLVGGGFIGLEVAAAALSMSHRVTVIEQIDVVMSRAVSGQVAEAVQTLHRAAGMDLRLGLAVDSVASVGARIGLTLSDGHAIECDELVVGVGLVVDDALAAQCGLRFVRGVVTDEHGATEHPAVVAFGDCAAQANGMGEPRRIESVANATDQARSAAALVMGEPPPRRPAPWFWSDQGNARLQVVGDRSTADDAVVRGDLGSGAFSVLYLRGDLLVAGEFLNRPGDALAARRLMEASSRLDRIRVADSAVRLRDATLTSRTRSERSLR